MMTMMMMMMMMMKTTMWCGSNSLYQAVALAYLAVATSGYPLTQPSLSTAAQSLLRSERHPARLSLSTHMPTDVSGEQVRDRLELD